MLRINDMVVDHDRPEPVERPVERGLPVARGTAQHHTEATVLWIGQKYRQLLDDSSRHLREYRHMPPASHICGIRLAQELIDILRLLTKQLKTAYCIPLNS